MRPNLKALVWAVVLAAGFLVLGASPAHAQSTCSTACTANTSCDTTCEVVVGGLVEDTTCGGAGASCCVETTTSTLYCTAQFLKANGVCVQVERDLITTTCGSISTSTISGTRQRSSPGGTCASCPSFTTPGCEDITGPGICG